MMRGGKLVNRIASAFAALLMIVGGAPPAHAEDGYDLWLRYGRRFLTDKVRWSVQLNIRDVFGSEDLIGVTAQPNGQVASARIPQPNKWTITNSFEF